MLIDWITARIDHDHFNPEIWAQLRLQSDRVQRYCPKTGIVAWETCAWESVRSDSHSLAIKVGGDALWVQGSPARVCGSGDAVFGEGAASALDLQGCLLEMIKFASNHLGVYLPLYPELWHISRTDITQNIMLDSLADVRVALGHLRECEGGRYRVSQQAGDTVYWSHRSKLRSGKAYAKGPHVEYMLNNSKYTGRDYSLKEREASNKLLRLEEKLGCKFFERKHKIGVKWYDITPEMLRKEWSSFFERMIGKAEMTKDIDIRQKLQDVAPTPGQGRSAHACWLLIQHAGWQKARESYPDRTWYRHIKILHKAGLGDMDISNGAIVPFRLKILEARQVNTWQELIKGHESLAA